MVSFIHLVLAVPAVAGLPLANLQPLSSKLRGQSWLGPQLPVTSPIQRLLLPSEDLDPSYRRREVEVRKNGFLYGPSRLGNSSYFPAGVLGDAMVQQHQDKWYADAAWLVNTVSEEAAAALSNIQSVWVPKHHIS